MKVKRFTFSRRLTPIAVAIALAHGVVTAQVAHDTTSADVLDNPNPFATGGQPETANFTLCGAYMRHSARSRSLPICVLSWVPKRHHSLPTQVFTVRSALA